MLHLENPINIMTGGYFRGDSTWNDNHRKSDDCYKIYYLTSGSIWIEDDAQRFHLEAGRIYIVNGYKIKRYGSESTFDVHWIHFIPQNIDTNRALYSLSIVVESPDILLQLALRNDIYSDNLKRFDSDNIYSIQYQLKLHNHIQDIIIEAISDYDWSDHLVCSNQNRISPALKYIDENYNKNISLDTLANLCNLSASHFHKIFTCALHITPGNYITQMRMNRALTLISRKISIKEISYELGYCNDAHFSRTFKKYYGFPPGLFRSSELLNSEFARQLLDRDTDY